MKPEASSQVARLLQVTPPDEDAGVVDDPVSNNALAQRNLAASRTWHPRSTDDGEKAAPRGTAFWYDQKHLSAAEQAALLRWGQTAAGLRAARDAFLYDEALDAHREFARKYVAVNSSTLGAESFDLETSPVMQADTVLLGFPLDMGEEFFPLTNTRRNDLLNAERAYIDSAPCMTWSVQTSGWLSLKMLHKAKQGLHKAFANAQGDFRIWTEFPGGGTTHFLTGMGGFLQTMTYGMAGLRLYDYGMLISPNLLPSGPAGYAKETSGSRSYVLRGVWFLGCQLRIEWGETEKENKKMQMLYRITVMKCEDGAQSPEHHSGPPPKKSFPIVARWLKVAEEEDMGFEFGDGVNRHGPATVIEMERAFEEDSLQLDFHPDFGAYRHYDKSGFPPLLLQHKQDQPKWPERPPALDEYKHCDRSDIPFKKGKQTGFRGFKIVPGIVTNQGYGDEVAVEMAKVKISVSSEPQEDRRMSETKSSGGDDGAEKCREWCNEGAEECDRWIWNQNEKTCLLQVDGAEKCREACEEAAECDRWMWNKDEETCYFYLYKPAHASSPQPSGRMEEPWRFRLPPYLLQDDCCVLGSRCDTDPRLDVSERWWERERQGGQVSGTSGAPTATAAALKTGADGLVLTKTEADGMKAKAAAELKAWQDDEAARNAKTEKRLSKWDLKDINRLFTSSQTPLAAPHDSKKYTGGTPAVDPGGSGKAFGGISMQDGPQGFRGAVEKGKTVYGEGKAATMLPAAAAVGMSWDPEFAYVYARAMAREFRMNRANMILGPTVTTWRVPLSGRNFESLAGEDPAIAATLLPAYKQATNEMGVSTSLKHYMMNDWEKDRKTNRVSTPLTAVFELQLKAFAAGIAMGGTSVMCSYTWLCVPDEMGVVKKQNCLGNCLNKDSLGWILPLSDRFFVVSDWAGTGGGPKNENNYGHDDDPAFYMHAGLSSEQPDKTLSYAGKRVFQPESGRGLDAVDAGLRRKMAQRIVAAMEDVEKSGGDLLKDKTMSKADYKSEIDTKHRKIGHRLVAESVVLLKNEDHALPLLLRPGDGEKGVQITTYGCATKPHGNLDCSCWNGGRNCSWCKKNGIVWDDPENVFYGGSGSGSVDPNKGENEIQTIAAALDAAAKEVSDIGVEVLGHKDLQSTLTLGPKGGAASGGKREVALVCASTGSGESADRGGLKLNKLEKLIKSQKGAAFQVVLFMSTPGYIDLPVADIVDPADAILLSVFPGQYVGAGLMQLLFNKTPPSAKLTFTIGNYEGKTYEPNTNSEGNAVIDYTKTDGPDGMQTGYRWYQAQGARPLFPFGHGLTSLADWGKDFKVSVSRHDATLRRISFCVDFFMPAGADAWTKLNAKAGGGRNEVKASPVVQFYVKKQKPVTRNYLELLTFAKLREMKPGEKRCGAVFYTEPVATYSPAKRKYIPSTEFQLWVGLNGYGAESGATQVPATTKAAQPELPEYTLQDYRNFVIETGLLTESMLFLAMLSLAKCRPIVLIRKTIKTILLLYTAFLTHDRLLPALSGTPLASNRLSSGARAFVRINPNFLKIKRRKKRKPISFLKKSCGGAADGSDGSRDGQQPAGAAGGAGAQPGADPGSADANNVNDGVQTGKRRLLFWKINGDSAPNPDPETGVESASTLFPPAKVVDVAKLKPLAAKATSFAVREKDGHPETKCPITGKCSGNDCAQLIPCLMPEIGNGYLATVSPICHTRQQGCGMLFVAGMWEGGNNGFSRKSALPNPFYGVWPKDFGNKADQVLDVKGGSLVFVFSDGDGKKVQFRFYAHRSRRNLLVFEITTTAGEAFDLGLEQKKPAIDVEGSGGSATGGAAKSPTAKLGEFSDAEHGGGKIRVSSTKEKEHASLQAELLQVAEAHSDATVDPAEKRLSKLPPTVKGLSKDKPFLFLVAFASNTNEGAGVVEKGVADAADLAKEDKLKEVAQKAVQDAEKLGAEALYKEHANAWARLWQGGVEIAGEDPTIERTTMFSMYYLLSSFRADVSWSSSPGGLSTNGYNGHVFWDAELWMYPGMLLFFPDIAKTSFLQYRVKTVKGALARSAETAKKKPPASTKGARFAWEASITGVETGPDGYPSVTNEIHNTACIAIAADLYYRANRGTKAAAKFLYEKTASKTGYDAMSARPAMRDRCLTNSGDGKVKFLIRVVQCSKEGMVEDGDSFPLVLRWYKVATGHKLSKQEHPFAAAGADFQPDFGSYRTFDKEGFPTVLLQHKQDAAQWPPVDNVLQLKKT
eukprot:g19069.t1